MTPPPSSSLIPSVYSEVPRAVILPPDVPAGRKRAGSRGRGQGRAPGGSSATVRPTSSSPSGPSSSCQLGVDQLSGSWNKAEPVHSMFRCNVLGLRLLRLVVVLI